MISYDAYNLLKAAVEKHIFSEYEEMVASRLCRKYEEYERACAAKKEAYAQEMKNLMLGVLERQISRFVRLKFSLFFTARLEKSIPAELSRATAVAFAGLMKS